MTGKKLFGAANGMKQLKKAAHSAPAFSNGSSSASIMAAIYWTVTVRC